MLIKTLPMYQKHMPFLYRLRLKRNFKPYLDAKYRYYFKVNSSTSPNQFIEFIEITPSSHYGSSVSIRVIEKDLGASWVGGKFKYKEDRSGVTITIDGTEFSVVEYSDKEYANYREEVILRNTKESEEKNKESEEKKIQAIRNILTHSEISNPVETYEELVKLTIGKYMHVFEHTNGHVYLHKDKSVKVVFNGHIFHYTKGDDAVQCTSEMNMMLIDSYVEKITKFINSDNNESLLNAIRAVITEYKNR